MYLPELIEKKLDIPDYARKRMAHGDSRRTLLFIGIFAFLLIINAWLTSAPSDYPSGKLIVVERGETLSGLARDLRSANAIRSEVAFKILTRIIGGAKGIDAGDYRLADVESAYTLARRFSFGDYKLKPIRVTIPEGKNVYEIAGLLESSLEHFEAERFIDIAEKEEGYLFPDTYFFIPGVSAESVVKEMRAVFADRLAPLEGMITAFGKPLQDVITMASILEEEARTKETMGIISGILWKRLSIGMPLQVDAVFPYIYRRDIRTVSLEDLEIDSLYNTYKYTGLPPGPISNPGLKAIEAAISPVASRYYYYLTDRDGVMHYAVTHDQHVANKAKYLR